MNDSLGHLIATAGSLFAGIVVTLVRWSVSSLGTRLNHMEIKVAEMAETLARLDERTKRAPK
jgi:hypothetical protein